jgi:hypothetical protein
MQGRLAMDTSTCEGADADGSALIMSGGLIDKPFRARLLAMPICFRCGHSLPLRHNRN